MRVPAAASQVKSCVLVAGSQMVANRLDPPADAAQGLRRIHSLAISTNQRSILEMRLLSALGCLTRARRASIIDPATTATTLARECRGNALQQPNTRNEFVTDGIVFVARQSRREAQRNGEQKRSQIIQKVQ